MSTIAVIGGTGYAGASIVAEAVARGHSVHILSRTAPEPAEAVTARVGSALDAAAVAAVINGADAVVGALSPRGELTGKLGVAYAVVADAAAAAGIPFVVVGGFSSLRVVEGGARIADGDEVHPAFAEEAREVAALLPQLEASDADWIFVSPPAVYGAHAPGEATGRYRLGGDVLVTDGDTPTALSGPDFAKGIVDIIESADHHRVHLSLS